MVILRIQVPMGIFLFIAIDFHDLLIKDIFSANKVDIHRFIDIERECRYRKQIKKAMKL